MAGRKNENVKAKENETEEAATAAAAAEKKNIARKMVQNATRCRVLQ